MSNNPRNGKYLKRFSEIPRLKLTVEEGFCEDLSCEKTRSAKIFVFALCIKFDKRGNSCTKHFERNPNIR